MTTDELLTEARRCSKEVHAAEERARIANDRFAEAVLMDLDPGDWERIERKDKHVDRARLLQSLTGLDIGACVRVIGYALNEKYAPVGLDQRKSVINLRAV